MPYDVKLPDIGEGVAEGEIVRWMVRAGETVREDQPLVEVMTDKATVEIPSPRAGEIAALLAEEGQVVPVGTVIVRIAVAGETADAAQTPAHADVSAATSAGNAAAAPAAAAPSPAGGRAQALPAVRQLARRLAVDIDAIEGTGAGGRVTAEDVERTARSGHGAGAGSATSAPSAESPAKAGTGRAPAPGSPATASISPGTGTSASSAAAPTPSGTATQRVPLRGLRRRIAEHMRRSIDTAAHFTFVAECDFTALVAHRERVQSRAGAAGVRLTYLAYVARALAGPLHAFPYLNAWLDDGRGEIVLEPALHLGIATHTSEGLMVPVIHDADRKSLFALARAISELSEGARAHKLPIEALQGGTFTVTSTGAKGGVLATPILHHPQVAILGVHEIRKKPAVVDDRIVIRQLGNLSLSLDHRVVDGAVGADFLYALIEQLEHPERWLTEADLA